MRSSLSRNFLLGVGATSVAFTITAALAAFAVFQNELAHRQIGYLAQYVEERSQNIGRRFSNLVTLQHTAVETLARRNALMSPTDAHALIDRKYPLQRDGTRRSRPEAFDGYVTSGGRLVYGMGGFMGQGARIDDAEARALASADTVVSAFGPAAHGDYDNFYFFTPNNRLIMFGPDRPDHLSFYRQTAPADLDFSKEEMTRLTLPSANPRGLTRCTSLQRLLQENAAPRVGTACVTPAYLDGRYAGAFGTTVNLTAFFADAVKTTLPGAASLIVRGDGALIAYPSLFSGHGASESDVAHASAGLHLQALVRRIQSRAKDHGVVLSPDGRRIVAYARLNGPDWYLLMSYPATAVAWSAARSASVILVLGLAAALLQTLVILRMARSVIVRPLQDLALSCEVRGSAETSDLQGRRDEIGVLARALAAERDRADELLSSLEQRVLERTAELEKANAEKSRFLANMSHELRTPLNGVIAVSETLAREQVTPRNVELAQLIVASGRLLEQVLTDILDFSKIEAGEMRLERQSFNLQTVVSRVAELHRASADAKGVSLDWRIAPEACGSYLGDSIRLTQVLSNLLSNAVKFTAAGRVSLAVAREGERLAFQVRDTGIGFDEATKARLFHRFEQADVSIRRRFGGTGLGLAICRSLVELMGGEIDARSSPGEGAVFTVRLALPEAVADLAASPACEAEPSDLSAVRVLLAEDHPTNQRVVALILDSVGVELTIVENGALALEASATQAFDVILMDMQMPEMDGLTATALIRAREMTQGAPRTPIIMLTANALDDHVQASLSAGADLHLAKPLRPQELLDAMAAFVSPAEEDGEAAEAA